MPRSLEPTHHTLEAFFYQQLGCLSERIRNQLPEEVQAYVVFLLAAFARRTQVAGRQSPPLGLQYLRARQQAGAQRACALRRVGDRALYIAGVVPRSLARGPVDVQYVSSIGQAAYQEIAAPGPLEIFRILAEKFVEIREVMGDLVDLGASDREVDLLELYQRWRRYGDPRDARRLVQAGVRLSPDGTDTLQ